MSMKAARKSLPSFSSSAVLCCAVRVGQVSIRQKMITTTMAIDSATNVKATGHEIRPEITDFDIGRCTLSVCFTEALIEHDHEHEQEQEEPADFAPKNYRPPHPIGVKGGCSPQNNRKKLGRY